MVELWIDETKKRIEDEKRWAEVVIKTDEHTGQQHISVLAGGKKEGIDHFHMGMNLDTSLKYFQTRQVVKTISKKMVSKEKGLVQDSSWDINPDLTNTFTVVLSCHIVGKTGEVKIMEFRFE